MADKYIDADETQIYGPHAARQIRQLVVGLLAEMDAALEFLAAGIETATTAVGVAREASRDADAALRKGAGTKVPALTSALSVLGRFSKHLDTHAAGTIDRKVFFAADGTAGGVGRGAPSVLLAVDRIAGKLKAADTPVHDADRWRQEFVKAARGLRPAIEHSNDARTDRSLSTPEGDNARAAWMTTYVAARCIVEGVLRLTGRLDQLSLVFHDLAVPAGAKVTEIPPDPPAPAQDPGTTH